MHVSSSDDAPVHHALGSEFRILLTKEQSGGRIGLFEERNDPGAGPPLHVHPDADETFLLLDGRYRFRCGKADVDAGPGAVVFVPRGTPHTFLNVGDGPGRFRCVMTPAGFEGFFPAIARRNVTLPDDMESLVAVGRDFGLELVGPNPFAATP